jgi:hypothetical protein
LKKQSKIKNRKQCCQLADILAAKDKSGCLKISAAGKTPRPHSLLILKDVTEK